MEAVTVTETSKIYRDFWKRPKSKAVNNISFSITQGEIVGLLGPNGSGKSTTIKMILNLLKPTSGDIRIYDSKNSSVDIKNRVGYLPEETYLYKFMTVYETLKFFGSFFKLKHSELKQRCLELAEMTGLSNSLKRPVGELSKGMARRVGLAQSLINNPDLLILDEPTSGLDPIGCREMKELLLHLKSKGKTILLCSHLLSDVEDVCDRVIIMYAGKIRAEGTLNELLTDRKKNRITLPTLPKDSFEKLMKVLKSELQNDQFVLDSPKTSLEDYFISVINRVKSEGAYTYGANSGGKIPDFLERKK